METQNEAQPTGPVADADPRERRLIGMAIGGAGYRPAPDWAWRYAIQDRTPLDEPTRSRLKAHLDRAVELAAGLPSPRYLRREPLDLDHLDAVLDTKIGHGLPPSDSDAITAWCLDIAVREMGGWWAPGPPEPLAEPHWVQIPDLGAVAVTAASNSPFSGLISMPPLPRLCAVGADRPRLLDCSSPRSMKPSLGRCALHGWRGGVRRPRPFCRRGCAWAGSAPATASEPRHTLTPDSSSDRTEARWWLPAHRRTIRARYEKRSTAQRVAGRNGASGAMTVPSKRWHRYVIDSPALRRPACGPPSGGSAVRGGSPGCLER